VESHVIEHEDEWVAFLSSSNPESAVPTPWDPSTRKSLSLFAFKSSLIVSA
jgi:hypothetical protein